MHVQEPSYHDDVYLWCEVGEEVASWWKVDNLIIIILLQVKSGGE